MYISAMHMYIDYVDIAGRSSARGSTVRIQWSKMSNLNLLYMRKYLASGK